MAIDDGLGNRQAEAGAFGTAGYHGRKNGVQHVLGNPGSVVDDVDATDQSMPLAADGELPAETINEMIEKRNAARAAKDFAAADALRDKLAEAGIQIEDGPDGTTWRRT